MASGRSPVDAENTAGEGYFWGESALRTLDCGLGSLALVIAQMSDVVFAAPVRLVP